MAGGALAGRRHRYRDLRPVHRLVEAEADLGLGIAPTLLARPLLATTTEERGEDVAEVGGEAATTPREAAGAREAASAEAREALLGLLVVRVAIGMPLPGQVPVGLLDLVLRGVLLDAQDLVEVARVRH